MDMARRRVDLRLPEELLDRLDERAEALGQTRTKFVERALESALEGSSPRDGSASPPRGGAEAGVSSPVSASTRAPSDALKRQAALNKAKGF